MASLKFNKDGTVADPSLILMTKSGVKLGQIVGFEGVHYKHYLNSPDEIAFTVHKYLDGERNPIWDKLVDFKVVWYVDVNQCFEIEVEITEDDDTTKQVTGAALAESELSQLLLFDTEINTENDIAREDYSSPTVFYNAANSSASLLDRILNKAPHYHIAHVDSSLTKTQRTFSFDKTSIMDALNEVAEEIECLFLYDSSVDADTGKIVRSISAYDLMNSCRECGKRFEGSICPKCGSADFNEGYGTSTGIVIAKENLAENISFDTDTGSVKNCFRLEGGDDDMTALIRACNPNGSNYIWNITDEMRADMSPELVQKLESYDRLYRQYATTKKFKTNTTAYNAIVDKYISRKSDLRHIYSGDSEDATSEDIKLVGVSSLIDAEYSVLDLAVYLQTSMMPTYDYRIPSATEQCATIKENLTTVTVTNATTASAETVETAIKALAKLYAHTEAYRVEVTTKSYAKKKWRGAIVLTNYSDDTDTASTYTITVKVNDTATNYAEELVQKKINEYTSDKFDIASLFNEALSQFKLSITEYSLDCLKSFDECCQACISVLVDQGAGDANSASYKIYKRYYNRLKALETEINTRSKELAKVGTYDNREGLLQRIVNIINNVHKALNFESYVGTELWNELIAYRREQEYSNSNYRADGLSNAEMVQNARGFYEAAEAELYKSSHSQHSISAPLKNLLAMHEFEGLTDNFDVGNWIYVIVDEKSYKLRLVAYEINFDDIQSIDVEFSDLLAIQNGVSDLKSVVDAAKSISSSYGTVYKQAAKGDVANKEVKNFYATGINGAKIPILSNDTSQDIQLGDSGLLGRRWIEEDGMYSPEQCRMTSSTLAFTDDGWQTSKAAIGKVVVDGVERYGVVADYIVGNMGKFVDIDAARISSGTISADRLDLDELFAKNITATGTFQVNNGRYFLIQTESGLRLGLSNGDGEVFTQSSYFEAGDDGIVLSTSMNNIKLYANRGSVEIYVPSAAVYVYGGVEATYGVFGQITPKEADTYNIGSSTKRWLTLYSDDVDVDNELIIGSGGQLTVSGYVSSSLRPNGTYNLGSTSYRWNNVYANAVDIGGNPAVAKQTKTVTGTTTANGNVSLSLASGTYGVLSVHCPGGSYVCTPYTTGSNDTWYAHITSQTGTTLASTDVSLTVDYYAK